MYYVTHAAIKCSYDVIHRRVRTPAPGTSFRETFVPAMSSIPETSTFPAICLSLLPRAARRTRAKPRTARSAAVFGGWRVSQRQARPATQLLEHLRGDDGHARVVQRERLEVRQRLERAHARAMPQFPSNACPACGGEEARAEKNAETWPRIRRRRFRSAIETRLFLARRSLRSLTSFATDAGRESALVIAQPSALRVARARRGPDGSDASLFPSKRRTFSETQPAHRPGGTAKRVVGSAQPVHARQARESCGSAVMVFPLTSTTSRPRPARRRTPGTRRGSRFARCARSRLQAAVSARFSAPFALL